LPSEERRREVRGVTSNRGSGKVKERRTGMPTFCSTKGKLSMMKTVKESKK